jgi:hypothetical protein
VEPAEKKKADISVEALNVAGHQLIRRTTHRNHRGLQLLRPIRSQRRKRKRNSPKRR